MSRPTYKAVYDDPNQYRSFIFSPDDGVFEGQHFERKQAMQSGTPGRDHKNAFSRFIEKVECTISGFANATGGLLAIGVSTQGECKGVDHLSENEINRLMRLDALEGATINSKLYSYQIDSHSIQIGLLMVEPPQRSICFRKRDGKAWIRKGMQTVALTMLELEQLKRDRHVVDFERTPAADFDVNDVDEPTVHEFAKYREYTNMPTIETLLREVGAIEITEQSKTFQWTNAGLLFFASNPSRILAQAYIRLIRFDCNYSNKDAPRIATFDKEFNGNLTTQIRNLRSFLSESGFFKQLTVRHNEGRLSSEPEYPSVAIDEAIVNAVVHRDYGSRQPIQCEQFSDAFVVTNPGRMLQPDYLPRAFYLGEHNPISFPRNRTLINWMRGMKDAKGVAFVKDIGEGTRSMQAAMEELGLPPPLYEQGPVSTRLTLRNNLRHRLAQRPVAIQKSFANAHEVTNLYRLDGFGNASARRDVSNMKNMFMSVFCDKLVAKQWMIDYQKMGRVIAHPVGERLPLPQKLQSLVRLIPTYAFAFRSYYDATYLAINYKVRLQTMLTVADLINQIESGLLIDLEAYLTVNGKPTLGVIKSIDDHKVAMVKLRTGEDVASSIRSVFPRLRPNTLNELINKYSPGIDISKEVFKTAYFGSDTASHSRALKISSVATFLKHNVFPIEVRMEIVTLDDKPLALHEKATGSHALRISQVGEPGVEFRHQRITSNVRQGITQFGAYDGDPRPVNIIGIVDPGFEQSMTSLIRRLNIGSYKYKGNERTFAATLALSKLVTAAGDEKVHICKKLVDENPQWFTRESLDTLVLAHTPRDAFAADDVTAPYYRMKRVLLEAGMPCQMIDSTTLLNPHFRDLNLSLNIMAKTGTTPWVLPESIPDADVFIGLSYTQRRDVAIDKRIVGFANVFNGYGRWKFYSAGTLSVSYSERTKLFEHLIYQTLERLALTNTPTVYIHYSAKFSRKDRQAILRGAQRVRPNGRYVFVWINTQHPIRLFDRRRETDGSVARGRYITCSDNQIILSTTGYNPYGKRIGTPTNLEINVYRESDTPRARSRVDLRAIARQILCLTKLNWASSNAICSEPITTKYAKDIAYLVAAFHEQNEQPFRLSSRLEHTPWFI